MSLTLTSVDNRRDKRDFLDLPGKIYAEDSKWVPPIRGQIDQLLGWKKHAFYNDAESQAFLVRQDDEPVGRVLAILNRAHNRTHDEEIGFFGFFETVNDGEVVKLLLDAAKDWLAERGITRVRGPVNPSLNHESGLLVEGFDTPPYFMMTHNPSYYKRLLKRYGCKKAKDQVAYIFVGDEIPQIVQRYKQSWQVDESNSGITVRNLDPKNMEADVQGFLQIYNESMRGLWGSVPLSPAEIKDIVSELKWLLVPELVAFAEQDGRIVGAAVALLDFNPIIRDIKGKIFPLGFVQLLRRKSEIKRARVMAMNVTKDQQASGLGGTLLAALMPALQKWRFNEFEVSWVLEDNKPARLTLETAGGHLYKRYRIYDYE